MDRILWYCYGRDEERMGNMNVKYVGGCNSPPDGENVLCYVAAPEPFSRQGASISLGWYRWKRNTGRMSPVKSQYCGCL